MNDVGTDVGLVVLESLDFDLECESRVHHSNRTSHGGPATHYQIAPCSGSSGLRCEKYMARRMAGIDTYCSDCGESHVCTYIPIPKGAAT